MSATDSRSPRVLVTGANGFIGRPLCKILDQRGFKVRAAMRSPQAVEGASQVVIGDISGFTGWNEALSGVDTVIHLAGRAHIMDDTAADPMAEYRRINRDALVRLAESASRQQVRRIVFVSTIKVLGEATNSTPFRHDSPAEPVDPYSRSKAEAEDALKEICATTDLEYTIVRPPLVYGPHVRANFLRLLKLARNLGANPFVLVRNRRSLVSVTNLVDALCTCAVHPNAADQTFLVSDGSPVSTGELLSVLARAMNRKTLPLPVPSAMFKLAGSMVGKTKEIDRLLGSLVVDDSHLRNQLDWTPPQTFQQGAEETTAWFLKEKDA
ncbi:MAG: NAD-dependent epimerase/dehydratase family protein [Desulfovibrio sp.]|uniref:NAD-dependent epimerase/dehydratase family protein n=1 Tax=Desulfovibrio sp. 7SRBS1 TaxID=3378064 RepID=UPI003B3C8DB4